MQWPKVWAAIKSANYGLVFFSILLGFSSMLIRSWRWQILLDRPVVSIGKLFLIMNIGFMGNGVFPARMGELIRPFLIWRYTDHAFPTAIATIVVERVFDLLGLLLILALVFILMPFPQANSASPDSAISAGADNDVPAELAADPWEWMQDLALLGVIAFIGLFGVIAAMSYAPEWSLRLAQTLFKPLPHTIASKLLRMVESFEKGAIAFRKPISFLYCLFYTLLLWSTIAFSEWMILWAFGIYHVPFTGALFLMAGLCFAVMFPQLPGYVGVYQFAVKLILCSTFFIDPDQAGAVALVMWMSQVPPVILLGFVCLIIMGVSFKEISQVQSEVNETGNPNHNE
jgi:uncharacterized membrane protein YbhN (UPF0104 family)